ncbi:MAG: TOBE domain-containing protein, partial [Jiangellaceae bacterium]
FMGEADFVPGSLAYGHVTTALGSLAVVPGTSPGAVEVMVRPHDVGVIPDQLGAGVVSRTEFRGAEVLHHVTFDGGTTLRALTPHTSPVAVGTRVTVQPVADHPLVAFSLT